MTTRELQTAIVRCIKPFLIRPATPTVPVIIWRDQGNPQPNNSQYITLKLITKSIKTGDDDIVNPPQLNKLSLDIETVTGNSIAGSIDGTPITPVVFTTNHADTMILLKNELLKSASINNITIDTTDSLSMQIESIADTDILLTAFTITGGATQPVITITELNNSASFQVRGFRQAVLSINGYGNGTTDDLTRLENAIQLPSFQSLLKQYNISIVNNPSITDLTGLVATDFEERCNMDINFYYTISATDNTGYIDNVTWTGTYE